MARFEFATGDPGGGSPPVVGFAVGNGQLVTVVLPGCRPTVVLADGSAAPRVLVHDPVSRLAIVEGAGAAWPLGSSQALQPGDGLRVAGGDEARVAGWARQHAGHVLPVSLLRLNYPGPVPAAGTPLLDDDGRVVAIGYQADPERPSVGYALPIEVYRRVAADFARDRRVVRTWLGLSLREGAAAPVLVRVEAGSPADRAGLREGDVLLQVGPRPVHTYPEAVNAFFYLVAGETVPIRVLRGVTVGQFELTPQALASGVGVSGQVN